VHPPRRRFLLLLLLLCLLAVPGVARAETWYVSAESGDDALNDGRSPTSPLATISAAAELLSGGDELVVGPGVYYEQPVFSELGSSEELPVLIRAEPTGGATISGMWRDAAEGEVQWRDDGGGLWSAEHGPVLFGAWDGHLLFRYELPDLVDLFAECVGEDCVDIVLPPYGLALAEERVWLRLPGGADPNGQPVKLSAPSWDEDGWLDEVVGVEESPWVILDGFRVEGSGTSCIFVQPDSPWVTVRNTVLNYCVLGIRLPEHGLVEWTEYAYPGFHEFAEDVRTLNDGELFDVFRLVKEYHDPVVLEGAIADSYTWWEPTPHDCEFRYNFMHQAFDGEWLGAFVDSESHHNVYLHNYDCHMELESYAGFAASELYFHDSLLLGGATGPISHYQHDGIEGPQYVYRNVVYGLDPHGWQTWTQLKSKAPTGEGGFFYFHNLIWGDDSLLLFEDRDRFTFRNNIFVFSHLQDSLAQDPATPDADFNLLVNDVEVEWLQGPGGSFLAYDPSSVLGEDPAQVGFVDPAGLDFGLLEGSPARDAGVELPGFNDGAPGGPDLGPFEVEDAPGPGWPRPMTTTFSCDPPERWNGAPPPPPEGCEDDLGDDDDDGAPPAEGCDCAASVGGGGSAGLALLPVAAWLGRRRREG